jgi:hypothetical protein
MSTSYTATGWASVASGLKSTMCSVSPFVIDSINKDSGEESLTQWTFLQWCSWCSSFQYYSSRIVLLTTENTCKQIPQKRICVRIVEIQSKNVQLFCCISRVFKKLNGTMEWRESRLWFWCWLQLVCVNGLLHYIHHGGQLCTNHGNQLSTNHPHTSTYLVATKCRTYLPT